MNNKIAYIKQLYQSKQELFIVEDGIMLDEIQNVDGIKYMFDTCEICRTLITANDMLHIQPQSTFSKSLDEDVLYNRYVFNIEAPAKLNLSVFYELNLGKMALWIVSPEGEILHQIEPTDNSNQVIELDLPAELYSIVLVHELDNGRIRGEIIIQGEFLPLSAPAIVTNIRYPDETIPINEKNEYYASRSDGLIEIFEKYTPYGLTYYPKQDAVYYIGEMVKLFVEFKLY